MVYDICYMRYAWAYRFSQAVVTCPQQPDLTEAGFVIMVGIFGKSLNIDY